MVKATRGVLVTCDPAVKQIILLLDSQATPKEKFLISDLDDEHLLIRGESLESVKRGLEAELEKNNWIGLET